MLQITRAVSQVRSFAEARGAWPCRQLDGQLALGFRGEICRGVGIGWDEFEVNFCAGRCVLVWDDAPGSTRAWVRSESEARRAVAEEAGRARPALPHSAPPPA
jgi:hypothetical protein